MKKFKKAGLIISVLAVGLLFLGHFSISDFHIFSMLRLKAGSPPRYGSESGNPFKLYTHEISEREKPKK